MDGSTPDILRVEVEVSGEAYRSLVVGLRSQHATSISSRPITRPVRALVDLTISEGRFSVSRIGHHRLPRPLGVKQGSPTHTRLATMLARSPEATTNDTLRNALASIIASCSTLHIETLRINPRDLELLPKPSIDYTRDPALQTIHASITPAILFDIDDGPTLVIPETPQSESEDAIARLQSGLRFITAPCAKVVDNFVEITAVVETPAISPLSFDLFIHWGSYEDLAPAWQDELLVASLTPTDSLAQSLYFRTHVPDRGWHGATFFAQVSGSSERIWIGKPDSDDAKFQILSDDFQRSESARTLLEKARSDAQHRIAETLHDAQQLAQVIETVSTATPEVAVAEMIAHAAQTTGDEAATIAALATNSIEGCSALSRLLHSHYGIGEIVFATPEGPQAAAGGLAQVISGLPPELCKAGIPVSIITPLYRYDNGNKHRSAERILEEGITIESTTIRPQYVGSITVHLGPTYHSGTTAIRRAPTAVPMKVYLAQRGNLRVFLLLNNAAFDRVYQPVYADEQLRRAVLLSRAILETVATEHFGIRPAAIISNDWMTACIPAFVALDDRYRAAAPLRNCKTIHMIHNGGADYHGRLPCNLHNEDLWPLLNLSAEHFFGFRDPHRSDLVNLTMAATHHVSGGVITVSRPYAEQLCSWDESDGLAHNLHNKRATVFGVSNGISRSQVDSYLSRLTGLGGDELRNIQDLLVAKSSIRTTLQKRYGLAVNPSAAVVSFVGRLAEQKGLHLLSGYVDNTNRSTLEDLLVRHPTTQLIIAGPLTTGDHSAQAARNTIEYLRRAYPGRVAAVFDYIPHSTALEIIFGSSLFLMPSRFEPGGITQLEALAAGTLVVGRNVGGISATIENYNPSTGSGNGFLCNDYTPTAFANTLHWALGSIADNGVYEQLVEHAIHAAHSWADRAPTFIAIIQRVLLGEDRLTSLHIADANRARAATAAIA